MAYDDLVPDWAERLAAAETRERKLQSRAEKAEADAQRLYHLAVEAIAAEKSCSWHDESTRHLERLASLARAAIAAHEEK